MVGDSYRTDVDGANKAGVRDIHFVRGNPAKSDTNVVIFAE